MVAERINEVTGDHIRQSTPSGGAHHRGVWSVLLSLILLLGLQAIGTAQGVLASVKCFQSGQRAAEGVRKLKTEAH